MQHEMCYKYPLYLIELVLFTNAEIFKVGLKFKKMTPLSVF